MVIRAGGVSAYPGVFAVLHSNTSSVSGFSAPGPMLLSTLLGLFQFTIFDKCGTKASHDAR